MTVLGHDADTPSASGCAGDCQHCPQQATATGPFTGSALVGRSALFFLLPVITAIIGALVGTRLGAEGHQLAGTLGGLALGILTAMLMARRLWRPESSAPIPPGDA